MWSVPSDRRRAALQAKRVTPAQQRAKEAREVTFNAGFDIAIRSTTPAGVLRMIRFDHPKYISDRRELFEQWDLDRRVASGESV
jgi:hypothetical protein